MPADELLIELSAHVVYGKGSLVVGYLRMQEHLLQHVAKLLAQVILVVLDNGLNRFVGLFHHVPRYAGMRLLSVPRAAVRLTQAPYGTHEPVELGMLFGRVVHKRDAAVNLVLGR